MDKLYIFNKNAQKQIFYRINLNLKKLCVRCNNSSPLLLNSNENSKSLILTVLNTSYLLPAFPP